MRAMRAMRAAMLLGVATLLLFNMLVSRRVLARRVPTSPPSLHGRIVGQDHAFAHEVLRRHTIDGAPPADMPVNESAAVVIVGAGIAGLVAAWSLRRRNVHSVVVLELEEQAGGNARWGDDGPGGLLYPWGAHYVPIPSRRARGVRDFFFALGLLRRPSLSPREEADERLGQMNGGGGAAAAEAELHEDVAQGVPTCRSPTERLYYPAGSARGAAHGRAGFWRDGLDGLVPLEAMGEDDRAQLSRFRSLVQARVPLIPSDPL